MNNFEKPYQYPKYMFLIERLTSKLFIKLTKLSSLILLLRPQRLRTITFLKMRPFHAFCALPAIRLWKDWRCPLNQPWKPQCSSECHPRILDIICRVPRGSPPPPFCSIRPSFMFFKFAESQRSRACSWQHLHTICAYIRKKCFNGQHYQPPRIIINFIRNQNQLRKLINQNQLRYFKKKKRIKINLNEGR